MKTRFDRSTRMLASPTGIGVAALLACTAPATLLRADDHAAAPRPERSSRFAFSLLPKSLQRRPSLDFHVITELTAEGRKLAPPAADHPVYYIAQPGTFSQMGASGAGSETPPELGQLTRAMEAALANSHHVKATPTTPLPAIAVVFNYGSFARFSMAAYDQQEDQMLAQLAFQMDEVQRSGGNSGLDSSMIYQGPMLRSEERDTDALLPIVLTHKRERDEVLRRATLVGGEKFTRDLAKAFADEVRFRTGGGEGALGFGEANSTGPFHRFMNANENLMMLVEDSFNGCYFVIASAFDYRAMHQGRRVLLWRTKMTVNSSGISMSESLPALVRTAGPYLGQDMADAVTITRKLLRNGRVDIGESQVLESDVPLPGATNAAPSPAPAPAPSPAGAQPKP